MLQYLDCEGSHRYAFHWCANLVPPLLLIHRKHQQDALLHTWTGLVAGTNGSVDELTEAMGAGYVLGADPEPIISFSDTESVALSLQLELVYFNYCKMYGNALAAKFIY